MAENVIKSLSDTFGDKIIESSIDDYYRIHVRVESDNLVDVATYIHSNLGFNHANFCMGTDLDDKMEVAWYVGHEDYREILVLRVFLDREQPEIPSLRFLWSGMDWHERETFGMLGIVFKGHGDLRRLVLPDEWEGYPLRNDYEYVKPSYRKPEDELMS